MDDGKTAAAIVDVFTSQNVADSNGGDANLVDTMYEVAAAIRSGLRNLGNGDAATSMGALEAHGKAVWEGAEMIAGAIGDLATAIREHTEAVQQ